MEEERTCSMCGCILQEHEQTEIDDEWLCDNCAENHTVECDHCRETICGMMQSQTMKCIHCESCLGKLAVSKTAI
jgi:hypothetical protein